MAGFNSTNSSATLGLARVVREAFLVQANQMAMEICQQVHDKFGELIDEAPSSKEAQVRRDYWIEYKKAQSKWSDRIITAWRECLQPPKSKASAVSDELSIGLELVSTEEVENKILASRIVVAVTEKVHSELEDLKLRIRAIEHQDELADNDIFRPEVSIVLLIEQWTKSGMPADAWSLIAPVVQKTLIVRLQEAYKQANQTLIQKGVLPVIEFKDRVKGGVRSMSHRPGGAGARPGPEAQGNATGPSSQPGSLNQRSSWGGVGPASSGGMPIQPGRTGYGDASMRQSMGTQGYSGYASGAQEYGAAGDYDGDGAGAASMTPMARARVRAQGFMGQIKKLFFSHAGTELLPRGGGTSGAGGMEDAPSPALIEALSPAHAASRYAPGGTMYLDYSAAGVQRVASDLRQHAEELKEKATTKSEKAIVEIVALMFQAILAEDRIPPNIRVWFARLQMPVLRTALTDPDFLASTEHPARQLIDRMGSVVMGFETSSVQGTSLEAEIRRIVQVVEQYPETGKKVYQIVFAEFQKFLEKFLTEKDSSHKVIGVAQQVEQKETLTIQYTIEMRNLLKDLPVRDGLRDFLFKVWAEVLAVATMRKGAQHEDSVVLRKTATDLVWAASAKPQRSERAKVIQELPSLLQRLRAGMAMLSLPAADQEQHIKMINDTLADAFMSKTQAIDQERIDALAMRLSHLEDFVSDDAMGDLPLDAESIEMMLGVDASGIEVVTDGGAKPTVAMQAWAAELQIGTWYSLDHNGHVSQVQLVWRSSKKHLNLFATIAGKNFLLQGGRLASYLQAGLLLPQEEESLTVRATRDALTKIQANPERLVA